MSDRVSIRREAEVALEISDLTYRGKRVPPGHAMAIAAFLNKRGMLAPESGDPHPSWCPRCDLSDTSAPHNGKGDCPPQSVDPS